MEASGLLTYARPCVHHSVGDRYRHHRIINGCRSCIFLLTTVSRRDAAVLHDLLYLLLRCLSNLCLQTFNLACASWDMGYRNQWLTSLYGAVLCNILLGFLKSLTPYSECCSVVEAAFTLINRNIAYDEVLAVSLSNNRLSMWTVLVCHTSRCHKCIKQKYYHHGRL